MEKAGASGDVEDQGGSVQAEDHEVKMLNEFLYKSLLRVRNAIADD